MKTLPFRSVTVCFGAIADLNRRSSAAKNAAVFPYGLIPWPKYFCPKTSGRSQQGIAQLTADRRRVDGHVSTIARP